MEEKATRPADDAAATDAEIEQDPGIPGPKVEAEEHDEPSPPSPPGFPESAE